MSHRPDHLEPTRYGWATPAYLRGLNADLAIWCANPKPPHCGHMSQWKWEDLAERFGEKRDLWLVPWKCPICRCDRVTFTVLVRAAG